jgi:hypothetical protein
LVVRIERRDSSLSANDVAASVDVVPPTMQAQWSRRRSTDSDRWHVQVVTLDGARGVRKRAVQSMFDGLYPKGMQWYRRGDFVTDPVSVPVDLALK